MINLSINAMPVWRTNSPAKWQTTTRWALGQGISVDCPNRTQIDALWAKVLSSFTLAAWGICDLVWDHISFETVCEIKLVFRGIHVIKTTCQLSTPCCGCKISARAGLHDDGIIRASFPNDWLKRKAFYSPAQGSKVTLCHVTLILSSVHFCTAKLMTRPPH